MKILRSLYHLFLSWSGSIFYGKPSREVFVLGVTGTKGKSTVLAMVNEILKQAGFTTAVISSVQREVAGQAITDSISNTMPGRWKLQRFIKKAYNEDCDYVLIEVTSQGVVQHRHKFIDWDAGMFLNIHPEHIESHGSFENYLEAKLDFFRYIKKSKKNNKMFFVNKNDKESGKFKKVGEEIENSKVLEFSSDDVYKLAEEIKKDKDPDWLKADFNIENMAAASVFAEEINISENIIEQSFRFFKGVEGRMDFVQYGPFAVIVDYAHTPDSLRLLYKNLRESDFFSEDSKLIGVFGSAGGGRDKWKRPELGRVAGNYCDTIILTSEDPYDEDPKLIIKDIREGVELTDFNNDLIEEVDRKEAIKKAVLIANKGDVVAVSGIGSQQYFYGKNGKESWNEKEIIKKLLEKNNEV